MLSYILLASVLRISPCSLVQTAVVSQKERERWRTRTSGLSSKPSWPAASSAHVVFGKCIINIHRELCNNLQLWCLHLICVHFCLFEVLQVRSQELKIWERQEEETTCRSGRTWRRCSCQSCRATLLMSVLSVHSPPNPTLSLHDHGRPGKDGFSANSSCNVREYYCCSHFFSCSFVCRCC